jgi:hypothetical protein
VKGAAAEAAGAAAAARGQCMHCWR